MIHCVAILFTLVLFDWAGASERPNIVVILVDDMGWSDIGCYGGEIETPHLDQLAQNGVRFTQFYNTARCCPTRAALLTGLYQHQAGIGHMTRDGGILSYQGYLNDRCLTIGEAEAGAGSSCAVTDSRARRRTCQDALSTPASSPLPPSRPVGHSG